MNKIESLTFTVPLGLSAHHLAEQFCRNHCNREKSKQVYLNTLAVFVVKFYLRCMGIETDWQTSLSWNLVMQTLMDVADLNIINLGKLECRPVLPESQVVHIPPEVCSDRVGYVAVQLEESLRKATLLGFTKTAPFSNELPKSQLRSLEELLEHLRYLRQPEPLKMRVNLSQWFDNFFEAGWQSIEALLGTQQEKLAFSFRSTSGLSEASVKRAKLIDLGLRLGGQAVALLVAITPDAEKKVGILVQVHPTGGETYLPPQLRVSLLSESGLTLQEVQSRSQDNYIQLKRFRGNPRECFNIQVAFGEIIVTEAFVI